MALANGFLNSLQSQLNTTLTENGAVTNKSSLDPIVDFFGLAGAMRNTPEAAADLFDAAYASDPQTAVRTMFYLRDVRGGQGERDVFRACLNRLASNDFEGHYSTSLQWVPTYGRWDDVLHAGLSVPVVSMIQRQMNRDLIALRRGESVSLMAKWLPSENASSQATALLGEALATSLGMSAPVYRRILSDLRGRIRLLEQDMSENNWTGIDHSKIPSQAHRRHVKAFWRHTPDKYQAYLDAVDRGEKKINITGVYPYEIYDMVQKGQADYANVAWKNLPDYTRGNNAIVMADVSGSMVRPWDSANPISVSVSLALYFAERNSGVFKDYFMTFSGEPELVRVQGTTLSQKMLGISRAHWGQNTNLLSAFRAILKAGRNSPQDMPSTLYVISDMEFDAATRGQGSQVVEQKTWNPLLRTYQTRLYRVPIINEPTSVFETARREYDDAGLTLPHVVFWNVQARQKQTPALAQDGKVTLVSGLSPTIFAQAVEN